MKLLIFAITWCVGLALVKLADLDKLDFYLLMAIGYVLGMFCLIVSGMLAK